MCTLSAAVMGLTVLSGYNQYQAQKQQYKAQESAYNAQAKAAEQNARIAERQREQIAENYAQKQKQLDDRKRLILGQHAASAGASGISGGSLLDADAAAIGQYNDDSMNLLNDQRNDTHSAYINQVNYMNQAASDRSAARNIKAQSKNALFGTILSTATSLYGQYSQMKGANNKTPAAVEEPGQYMFYYNAQGLPDMKKVKGGPWTKNKEGKWIYR